MWDFVGPHIDLPQIARLASNATLASYVDAVVAGRTWLRSACDKLCAGCFVSADSGTSDEGEVDLFSVFDVTGIAAALWDGADAAFVDERVGQLATVYTEPTDHRASVFAPAHVPYPCSSSIGHGSVHATATRATPVAALTFEMIAQAESGEVPEPAPGETHFKAYLRDKGRSSPNGGSPEAWLGDLLGDAAPDGAAGGAGALLELVCRDEPCVLDLQLPQISGYS